MIDAKGRQALEQVLGHQVQFDVPMSRHTSLRVGGPAAVLATPADRTQLAQLLQLCQMRGYTHHVLGGGFNTLVLDDGVRDGVLISLSTFRALEHLGGGLVRAEAGVPHHRIIKFCEQHGFTGLEFAVGIPGTVGGWVAMNAGIGEREMKDVVANVESMTPDGENLHVAARDELRFEYRALCGLPSGSILLGATLQLEPGDPEAIRSEIKRLLALRASKQPTNQPSCGSVFKNPRQYSAGQLIDEAGLKGLRIGGAEISRLHANFIVNLGGATTADVLALIERAREVVKQRTGIELELEVKILGRGM